VPVGYSGHEIGYVPTLASVAQGASLVERHMTLDCSLVGFDHKLSLEPGESAEMVRAIQDLDPNLHVKAFTMVEIDYFARKFNKTIEHVFAELIDAGLGSCPGGGAEIFAPRARRKICKDKIDGDRWLEVMRIAHQVGLKSTCTLLYGHIETDEEIIDHLDRLRRLQDETGGFLAFIPLAFNPELSILGKVIRPTTGMKDMKMLAVARLYLDNIDHIKTYWITSGIEMAQLGLSFGADDVHGTVYEENIMHMAGAPSPHQLSVKDLREIIQRAGFTPQQRDSFYNIIPPRAPERSTPLPLQPSPDSKPPQ